jgi:hypothetical protein
MNATDQSRRHSPLVYSAHPSANAAAQSASTQGFKVVGRHSSEVGYTQKSDLPRTCGALDHRRKVRVIRTHRLKAAIQHVLWRSSKLERTVVCGLRHMFERHPSNPTAWSPISMIPNGRERKVHEQSHSVVALRCWLTVDSDVYILAQSMTRMTRAVLPFVYFRWFKFQPPIVPCDVSSTCLCL